MSAPPQEGPRAPASVHPIQVLELPTGLPVYVRFLGPLRQLGTHWTGERTEACLEELGCPKDRHGRPYVCKWYASGQEWITADQVWRRVVIEISEALELQFRDRNPRGEVWILTRTMVRKRRGKERRDKTKVTGEFLDRVTLDTLTEAFPVDPVLCHVFRELALPKALKRNPLPDRPLSDDEEGLPPPQLVEQQKRRQQSAHPTMSDEQREMWKAARARIAGRPADSTPTRPEPSSNGTGHAEPASNGKGGHA